VQISGSGGGRDRDERGRGTTAVIYVEKELSASTTNNCGKAPTWSLAYIDTGKQRAANTDVVTIRVATTTDGINFTDVGEATGLLDATATAFNGIRWLGSGSIIALSNGRYGMFFGAGNCLDNDSDGFHFMGYAETKKKAVTVTQAADLLDWTVNLRVRQAIAGLPSGQSTVSPGGSTCCGPGAVNGLLMKAPPGKPAKPFRRRSHSRAEACNQL
jgi:hypothetical protein